jgi:hypothetical protein
MFFLIFGIESNILTMMQPLFKGSSLQSYFDDKLRSIKTSVQKSSLEATEINTLKHSVLKYISITPLKLQLEKTKNSQVRGERRITGVPRIEYDGIRYEITFLGNSDLLTHNSPKSRNEVIPAIINGNTLSIDVIINGDISTTEVQEKISSDAQEIIEIIQWYIDEVNKEVELFNNKLESELDQMIENERSVRANKQSILDNTNPFKKSSQ